MRRPPEQDVLGNGHLRWSHRDLRHERDTFRELPAGETAERYAVELDRPLRADETRNGPQKGRLPGAVGADQRHPLPRFHGRRDVVQHARAAELDAQVLEGQSTHGPTIRLVRRTIAKKGAPKNAVTTPIGSSAGDIAVRAITSAKTRKPAPTTIESGRTIR